MDYQEKKEIFYSLIQKVSQVTPTIASYVERNTVFDEQQKAVYFTGDTAIIEYLMRMSEPGGGGPV